MPKRKKHPKLPSGWGSIKYLGKGRRNCYSVHPPAIECRENGSYIQPKALCYVDDWYVGFAMLNAWHAGKYHPGDEKAFCEYKHPDITEIDELCRKILTDHQLFVQKNDSEYSPTFAEVYEQFYDWKFGENASRKYSHSMQNAIQSAYRNCEALHGMAFKDIRLNDLQGVLKACTLKKSSMELIVTLYNQMYKYAEPRESCEKNYAKFVIIPDAEDDEHGVPFSDDDLKKLWKMKDNPVARFILIMCYSGFRIKAYETIEVNTEEWYFKGGVKTKSSKGRIVPIHSGIQSLVMASLENGKILNQTTQSFRNDMYKFLESVGIEKHTPHDCRHTFSALCEKYGVNEADRKRMLGHSFGSDITNGIYGHRTLDELRAEIEKIKICD